jgi:rhodanese-related sulfurtransferase
MKAPSLTPWSAPLAALVCALGLWAAPAAAIDADQVPAAKRSASGLHLTAVEAAELKQRLGDKVLMIDIRTRAEAMYVGMASAVDFLVPVLDFPEFWEWSDQGNEYIQQANPHFVRDIEARLAARGLSKNDPVILICRSGMRSNAASGLLFELGFKQAYTVIDGFEGDTAKDGDQKGQRVVNGWKNARLPWSYKLQKAKMYLDPL